MYICKKLWSTIEILSIINNCRFPNLAIKQLTLFSPSGWYGRDTSSSSFPLSSAYPGSGCGGINSSACTPQSHPFRHHTSLMTIGEDKNEDWLVDRELLSFHHNGAVKQTQYLSHSSDSPANLTLHHTLTREQDPEVLGLRTHFLPGLGNPPVSC